jgi:hypothetical protein
VPADGFDFLANLRPRYRYERRRIAEIAVVFRNFLLEHEVITKGVVGEFGQEPVVLMSVALPVSQDQRRIKVAFDGLEAILDIGTLEGEITVAKA